MTLAFRESFYRELAFLRGSFWDFALTFCIPFALMAVIAIQLSAGVMRDLPIAVVDQDGSSLAREFTRQLDAAPGLHVATRPSDMTSARDVVRSGEAYVVVLIPSGAKRAVLRSETASILVFYNASYSTASGSALREIVTVVQSYAGRLALEQTMALAGPHGVRVPPIAVHSRLLYNPQASYELQLVSLIHPALLHLLFMVAVVSALGRELRDGTIGFWLPQRRGEAIAAVVGKIAPYFLVFLIWGLLATAYLAGFRGWPVQGSVLMIVVGYAVMYLAYAAMAVLFVGRTLAMGQALSVTALYAGASFAFAGAIFPVESGSAFARFWSALLPYTAFARLVAEQWMMGAPLTVSLKPILVMAGFIPVGLALGLPRYLAAARKPEKWGLR